MRVMLIIFWVVALSAGPASAGPITAAIAGIFTPIAVGTATAAIIANFLLTAAISTLARMIVGKNRQTRPPGISTPITLTGDVNPEKYTLGTYATAGQLVYPPLTHNTNHNKVFVIILCAKPRASLTRIAIDGEWATITATVDGNYGNLIGGKYLNKAYVKFYDGTQTAADPMLVAQYGTHPDFPWTGDMVGQGLCYAIVTTVFDTALFPSIPTFKFELRGIPLYDVRLDSTAGGVGTQRWADQTTWAFSENPIVMKYNILRGITTHAGDIWGAQVDAGDLPFAGWTAAMDHCDEQVDDGAGGLENRYIAGIEVSLDMTPAEVLSEIDRASASVSSDVGGIWSVKSGSPAQPTIFITDDDILIDAARVKMPIVPARDVHNAVGASYVDTALAYQTKDAPLYVDAQALADDKNKQRVATIDLSAVTRISQVSRLQVAYLADDRRWAKHTMSIPARIVGAEPFDVVSWTSVQYGYSAQPFEVSRAQFDPSALTTAVTLREVNYADWV